VKLKNSRRKRKAQVLVQRIREDLNLHANLGTQDVNGNQTLELLLGCEPLSFYNGVTRRGAGSLAKVARRRWVPGQPTALSEVESELNWQRETFVEH
jgi:hypothetical protein